METKSLKKSIGTWPAQERPRERLRDTGPEALSDAELLAVLLRNGVRGSDAVSVSRGLLERLGGLRGLYAAGFRDLQKVRGLGLAKAASLIAATELGKRYLKAGIEGKCYVRDPQSVIQYLYGSIRDLKREVFRAIFLDKANRILAVRELFAGTIDEAAVHPREIVKAVLDHHATGVVLAHNHPSGRAAPSREDREITEKIVQACGTVSVKVVDHLIIGDNCYFSFREQGLLGL